MTGARTWDRERARFALDVLDWALREHGKDKHLVWRRNLRQCLRAAPGQVLTLGLGSALAWLAGQNAERAERIVYLWCKRWLTRKGLPFAGQADLMQALVQSDQQAYLVTQAEALALLAWLKKLVVVRVDNQGRVIRAADVEPTLQEDSDADE